MIIPFRAVPGWALLAVFLALIRPGAGLGQLVPLADRPTCSDCSIIYEVRAVLGSDQDPASPGATAEAARLPDGRVAVSSPTIGPQVLIYGGDGTFLHSLGRRGEGPGEFMSAPMIRASGPESFAFLDVRQGVVHHFDPEGTHLDSFALGMRAISFAVHPGGYVVSGPFRAEGEATAIHVFDTSGGMRTSFGTGPSDDMRSLVRMLAVAPDGTIWAAQVTGGMLEHWSADGELIKAYRIQNEDMQRTVSGPVDLARERPPAQVVDVLMDDDGRVWIWVIVPDDGSQPGATGGRPEPEAVYDTRVLVFDSDLEVIVASERFDSLLRPLGDGWAFDLVTTALGDRRVRVGTVKVEGF